MHVQFKFNACCTVAQGMILSNLVGLLSCWKLLRKIDVQRQLKMAELGLFEHPQPNMEAMEHFAFTILTQRSLHLCQRT